MKRIGQRVRIQHDAFAGAFLNKTGRIVGSEKFGRFEPPMYRVRLDEPVEIPGVGTVTDDLWQGQYLKGVK